MSTSIEMFEKSMRVLNHIANQEAKEIEEFSKYVPYETRKNDELIEVIKENYENKTQLRED